jgi:hypothetical protein
LLKSVAPANRKLPHSSKVIDCQPLFMLDYQQLLAKMERSGVKMSFRHILCVCFFPLLITLAISVEIAWGETVAGVVKSAEALDHTIRKWKSHMANTASKQGRDVRDASRTKRSEFSHAVNKKDTKKEISYGAFCWCITAEKKRPIRYAYTYGEADSEIAGKKAVKAFDAEGAKGKCLKPPRLLTITSDNL